MLWVASSARLGGFADTQQLGLLQTLGSLTYFTLLTQLAEPGGPSVVSEDHPSFPARNFLLWASPWCSLRQIRSFISAQSLYLFPDLAKKPKDATVFLPIQGLLHFGWRFTCGRGGANPHPVNNNTRTSYLTSTQQHSHSLSSSTLIPSLKHLNTTSPPQAVL